MIDKSLNLIPGSGKEFSGKDYWDRFFKIRGTQAFEWYGEYENLYECIHKYIKPDDNVLVIGCGNSKLSENMYDVCFKNITNIDLSEIVIKQMASKNKSRKDMKYLKMDMLNMEFESEKFDVVLDKGTLDALMSEENIEKSNEDSEKLFNEVERVLKVGGRYMCISLAQEHIQSKLLNTFKDKGWFIRIHRLNEQDLDFYLPVFVFIFTKMKMKLPNPMIEIKFETNEDKFQRMKTTDETSLKIKEFQNYGLTKYFIANKNVDAKDDIFVYLYDEKISEKYPRYTIFIVDFNQQQNKAKMNGLFAVFVVPIGKEIEWLFGTRAGREELTIQAKYQRLAIVHLNRAHSYETLDHILKELSPKVMELAPKGLPKSYKIPMLSMGPDVDVRNLRYKGISDISGEFYVEDIFSNELMQPTRRLIFQNKIPTIQTEVLLKEDTTKSGKSGKKTKPSNDIKNSNLKPNYDEFLDDYFSIILSQLLSLKLKDSEQPLSILIVGLGGGVLAAYLRRFIKNSDIDAVEIDGEIAKIAKDWFGLNEDSKLRIHVDDGLKFIDASAKAGRKWDVVIVDINNSDSESDLWAPTKEFLDKAFLNDCVKILSDSIGLFVMNMICNDRDMRKALLNDLKQIWPNIYMNKLPKNRNEILFCLSAAKSRETMFHKNPFAIATPSTTAASAATKNASCTLAQTITDGNLLLQFDQVSNSLSELKL